MHRVFKKKLHFDLLAKAGVNWAQKLPEYAKTINDEPRECLAWRSPFQVYFGRGGKPRTIRQRAKQATQHCNTRHNKWREKLLNTPVYSIGK
jgi:hypothetical protein